MRLLPREDAVFGPGPGVGAQRDQGMPERGLHVVFAHREGDAAGVRAVGHEQVEHRGERILALVAGDLGQGLAFERLHRGIEDARDQDVGGPDRARRVRPWGSRSGGGRGPRDPGAGPRADRVRPRAPRRAGSRSGRWSWPSRGTGRRRRRGPGLAPPRSAGGRAASCPSWPCPRPSGGRSPPGSGPPARSGRPRRGSGRCPRRRGRPPRRAGG